MNNSPSGSTDDLFSLALNSNTAFSFGAATAGDAPLSVQQHIDRVSGLVPDSSQAHSRPPFLGAQPPAQPQPQPQAPLTPAQQLEMMNMMEQEEQAAAIAAQLEARRADLRSIGQRAIAFGRTEARAAAEKRGPAAYLEMLNTEGLSQEELDWIRKHVSYSSSRAPTTRDPAPAAPLQDLTEFRPSTSSHATTSRSSLLHANDRNGAGHLTPAARSARGRLSGAQTSLRKSASHASSPESTQSMPTRKGKGVAHDPDTLVFGPNTLAGHVKAANSFIVLPILLDNPGYKFTHIGRKSTVLSQSQLKLEFSVVRTACLQFDLAFTLPPLPLSASSQDVDDAINKKVRRVMGNQHPNYLKRRVRGRRSGDIDGEFCVASYKRTHPKRPTAQQLATQFAGRPGGCLVLMPSHRDRDLMSDAKVLEFCKVLHSAELLARPFKKRSGVSIVERNGFFIRDIYRGDPEGDDIHDIPSFAKENRPARLRGLFFNRTVTNYVDSAAEDWRELARIYAIIETDDDEAYRAFSADDRGIGASDSDPQPEDPNVSFMQNRTANQEYLLQRWQRMRDEKIAQRKAEQDSGDDEDDDVTAAPLSKRAKCSEVRSKKKKKPKTGERAQASIGVGASAGDDDDEASMVDSASSTLSSGAERRRVQDFVAGKQRMQDMMRSSGSGSEEGSGGAKAGD
ncbi:BZ3501_MvSof-1269-A2-R1_Chr2-2g05065 [Microbotryum saponariae]|nr:BZ3501_MvSof-1269-A2-R1_Chr2-2g05065 [Microbotryum saponariae]